MPNWKKLITSGSDASLSSLFVTNAITASAFSGSHTGSLLGTASFASTSSNVLGGTTSYIPLWNSATTLGSSVMYQSSSNIGIGTTNPSTKLHLLVGNVEGARIESSNSAYLELGRTSGPRWRWSNEYNANKLFELLVNDLVGGTPTTSVIAVSGSGNVGIGTTSPAYNLDINPGSGSPNVRIMRTGGTEFRIGASITATGAIIGTYTNSPISLLTNSSTVMTLDTNGNIGIGTTSPSYKLHVVGDSVAAVASQPGISGYFLQSVDGRALIRVENNSSNPSAGATGTALSLVAYSDSSNNPGTSKHEAQILLGAKTSGQDGALRVIAPRNIDFYTNAQNVVMTGSAYLNYGSFAMTISGSGNIGIGTTSPLTKLHISGSATTASLRINRVGGLGSIYGDNDLILETDSNFYIGAYAARPLSINSANGASGTVYITEAGFMGIGTTSPSQKLTVAGNISSSAAVYFKGITSATQTNIVSIDTTTGQLYYQTTGSFIAVSASYASTASNVLGGTTNYLARWTSATTLGTGVTYDNGTNVGIGTASPSYKLDVSGSIKTTTSLTLTNGSGLSANNEILFSDNGQIRSTDDNHRIIFDRSNNIIELREYGNIIFSAGATTGARTNTVYIKSDGKVGIGTTSPYEKLEVAGAISAGGGWVGDSAQGAVTTMGYQSGYGFIQAVDWGVEYKSLILNPNGGNVGIGTTTPGQILDVNGRIRIVTGSTELYSSGNRIMVRSESTDGVAEFASYGLFLPKTGNSYNLYVGGSAVLGYSESATLDIARGGSGSPLYVRINSNGDSYFNGGNVGIGTSSPATTLHVAGTTRIVQNASAFQLSGSNHVYMEFYPTASAGRQAYFGFPSVGTKQIHLANEATSGGDIILLPGSGGNVGISDTSPSAKLSLVEANTGVPGIKITNWNSIYTVAIGSDSSTGGGKILLATNGGTNNVFISSYSSSYFNGGNVGIGTTSPSAKLNIAGALGSTVGGGGSAIKMTNTDTGNYASIGAGIVGNFNAGLQFSVDGTSSMVIKSDGNVGIGLVNPLQKLSVIGNIDIPTTGTKIGFDVADSFTAYGTNTAHYGVSWARDTNPLKLSGYFGLSLYTAGTERITITTGSGYVGINNSNPSYTLDVNGSFRASSYVVGSYTSYGFSIPPPSAAFGDGRSYIRLHTTSSGARIASFKIRLSTTWNYDPGFGYIDADVSYYFDGTSLIYPSVNVTSATGRALYSIALGDLVIEGGYVSLPVYIEDTNTLYVKVEGSPSFDYSLITTTSWSSISFPGPNTVTISGKLYVGGVFSTGGGSSNVVSIRDASIEQQSAATDNGALYINYYGYNGGTTYYRDLSINNGKGGQIAFFDGSTSRVGINQGAPAYALDVSGNIHATTTVYVDASNAAYLRGGDDHEWWDINVANTAGLYGLQNSAVGGLKLGSGGPTLFGSSSYLGIGTISPSSTLHVNGTFISNALWTNASSIAFWGPYSTAYGGLTWDTGYAQVYATSGNALRLGANGSNAHIYVNTSGNVGINNTSPGDAKLYVEGRSLDWNETTPGTSIGTIHLDPGVTTDNYGNAITFGASDSADGGNAQAGIYIRSDGTYGTKMYIATTDSYSAGSKTRIFINHNGAVGINTISPGYTFDVAGTIGLTSGSVSAPFAQRSVYYNVIYEPAGNVALYLGNNDSPANYYDNNYHFFRSRGGGTSYMTIDSDGEVGIGVTSPTDKLTVAGNLFLSGSGRSVWLGNNADSGNRLRLHQSGIYSYVDFHSGDLYFRADTNIKVSFSPAGTVTAAGDVVAYGTPSDISFKTNIVPIQGSLDKIQKLEPVSFTWKEGTESNKLANIKDDLGFIAQQVQEVLPELVRENDNGTLSLRERGIIPLLVGAIKELKAEIDILKNK